ncbi:MAG: cell division protein FtsA [Chloroflexota bacterium]|nr:MAG: cell division protein FtsA [Chloroflexota bacterium]
MPVPKDNIVVALDIGTTKICTLLAEVDRNQQVNVVGVGTAPSAGMRKGVVVDIDEAAQAIVQSVEKCERLSGYSIQSAYVGVTGSHITGANRRGVVAVSPNASEITVPDVERAMEAARVQAIANDREIIHVLARGYTLDGQDGVRDPIGMVGRRLEAEMHIVTGGSTSIRNLVRCVNRAGLQIDDLILQPLASSEAVLSPGEKDIGVAIADIGGGTTDVAVFTDGAVCYTSAIGVAGNHVTTDLSLGLRAPFSVAEQVKIEHGSACTSQVGPDEVLEVQTYDQDEGELISRRLVVDIIESRMQEILRLIRAELGRSGLDGRLPAGVVLVGGAAELRDIRLLGRDVLELPVRVGVPRGAIGLTDTIMRPAYATTIGLLRWAAYHTEEASAPILTFPQWKGLSRLRGMFREFLA